MKFLIIPVTCIVLGVGGGIAAGIFVTPKPESNDATHIDEVRDVASEENSVTGIGAVEYASLSSQFIVPLIEDGNVNGIVVLSIGLEVIDGSLQSVLMSEPKIRAAFLQSLFNHANNGGFSGNFTEHSAMESLRRELVIVARAIAGGNVSDVLILDVTRQET